MGHWGWRPLISALFIGVWVTGCSITSDTAPTLAPTSLPLVTLTLRNRAPALVTSPTPMPPTATPVAEEVAQARLYVVRPGDTLLGIALDYGVDVAALEAANPELDPLALQVGQQVIVPPPGEPILAATPVTLGLPAPNCREMITGKILCLGQVINTQTETVEQVQVRIRLLDSMGAPLAEVTTGIEQTLIPPGGAAPYSAIFDAVDDAQVAVSVQMAQSVGQTNWITLGADAAAVESSSNRVSVEANIHNPSDHVTGPGRVVLTLFDSGGQVAGFRVVAIGAGLEPGETRTIKIEAISQSDEDGPLTYQLYAEARWR